MTTIGAVGDVRATVDEGVGGAGVSWPGIGVGAFSVASRQPPLMTLLPPSCGVFDLAGVLVTDPDDDDVGLSVGDGR